jgi:hypothetical protein
MKHDLSAHREGPVRRTRNLVDRIVHGEPSEKIVLDIPCERCERYRCFLLGLKHPQPDWGTAAWVHPQPDTTLPAFTRPPVPPTERVPMWLVRAADSLAARALDATAVKHPAYPVSVEPSQEEQQPSPSGSVGSGGSAPF